MIDSNWKMQKASFGKPLVAGIIPARGGSKGISRKNIQLLANRPLLDYTIETALASRTLSLLATSTEDREIADIARRAGSLVIDRPPKLALDSILTLPVVQHAIRVIEKECNCRLDYVAVLQTTTPLLIPEDIDHAVQKLIDTQADSVVSVCKVERFHPWKLKRIINDQLVPYLENEIEGTRRQDLPPIYIRNGGIYAMRRDIVIKRNTMYGEICRPYIMPLERSVDINSELDLILIEILLSRRMTR